MREICPKEEGMKAERKDGLLRTSPGALAFGSDGQAGDRCQALMVRPTSKRLEHTAATLALLSL